MREHKGRPFKMVNMTEFFPLIADKCVVVFLLLLLLYTVLYLSTIFAQTAPTEQDRECTHTTVS